LHFDNQIVRFGNAIEGPKQIWPFNCISKAHNLIIVKFTKCERLDCANIISDLAVCAIDVTKVKKITPVRNIFEYSQSQFDRKTCKGRSLIVLNTARLSRSLLSTGLRLLVCCHAVEALRIIQVITNGG